MMDVSGSYAAPPHSEPPMVPGTFRDPCTEGGVKSPSYLKLLKSLRRESFEDGEKSATSSIVMNCLAYGAGFNGKGCVGEASSPGTSDAGTSLSSTGNSGLPVSRSST